MTKVLLGEIEFGLALFSLVYNCVWTFRHMPRSVRKRGVLFAFIFSLFPVLALSDVFGSSSRDVHQPLNGVYFIIVLIAVILGLVGYGVGLHLAMRRAAMRLSLAQQQ